MNNEYIIINKTTLLKRIEECDKRISLLQRIAHEQLGKELEATNIAIAKLYSEKDTLNLFLSQSTPLIPEIENAYTKAFSEGIVFGMHTEYKYKTSEDYISNLKFDI